MYYTDKQLARYLLNYPNYMLMLLNDEQKVIQYIPICFIFKTTLQP